MPRFTSDSARAAAARSAIARRSNARTERAVEVQAKVAQLVRLDRAEDSILAAAAADVDSAEHLLARAQDRVAAAKRVDALEDELIDELMTDARAIAGDPVAFAGELMDVARSRATAPSVTEAAK